MKKIWIGGCLLPGLIAILPGFTFGGDRPVIYGFRTRQYLIEMRVTFFDPYLGRRLAFLSNSNPAQALWGHSGDGTGPGQCIDKFVGSLAIARYSVKSAAGRIPRTVAIRDDVTISAQSAGLPYRAPFSMTITPVGGVWSDIQAFGYDESAVSRAQRAARRKQAQTTWWRLCKQELRI